LSWTNNYRTSHLLLSTLNSRINMKSSPISERLAYTFVRNLLFSAEKRFNAYILRLLKLNKGTNQSSGGGSCVYFDGVSVCRRRSTCNRKYAKITFSCCWIVLCSLRDSRARFGGRARSIRERVRRKTRKRARLFATFASRPSTGPVTISSTLRPRTLQSCVNHDLS